MQIRKAVISMAVMGLLTGNLLLSGCNQSKAVNNRAQAGLPEVAVVTIEPQRAVLTTELPGRTSASLTAEIRPQVNGLIQKRLFREGSDVNAGELLYQIDPAPFQVTYDNQKAALAKAEANLKATRLRAKRYEELLAGKAISRQDYDDAAAALQAAVAEVDYMKTAVEAARINLEYTRVKAPISGRIGKSNVTVGALVTAYQPTALATIQQLDPIYVDVPQSSSDLLRLTRSLKLGRLNAGEQAREVKLLLEDGSSYPQPGVLEFRDVTVNPTTGSVTLRILMPNPEQLLLPGMFVRAVVQEGISDQAILVDQQGVSRDPKGQPIALILDKEGSVQQRQLILDRAIGSKWLVSSGLSAGDRLIVEGLQRVRPGSKAKAIAFSERKSEKAPEKKDVGQSTES